MKESPLVSVLMTAYNREKYIAEAIESVLSSTYTNFELIIVDDYSKDKTEEIARYYEAKDSRVKVYLNEKNLGDYPNRNRAASYAKGKYLKYVDSDDMIYPFGLEQLVYYMEQFPNAGYGLCSLNPNINNKFPLLLSSFDAYSYHYLGPGLFHKAPLSAIIRKKAFDLVGGFIEERMVGDFEMWHKLSLKNLVVLMPQGIVWYRSHDSQEMNDYEKFRHRYREISNKYLALSNLPSEKIKKIKKKRENNIKAKIIRKIKRLYKII